MSNQKLSILALIFSIFLLAYSSNPPNGVTGAPGEGTCTNCHNGATGGLAGSVSITGLPGVITPNASYTITVTTYNTSSPPTSAERAGFELVAVDGNNANAGTFSSPGAGGSLSGSPKVYWKHSTAKTFGGGGSVSWNVTWKAPASAGGNTVSMYVASIIADIPNGNNNDLMVLNSTSGSLMGVSINIAVTQRKNPSCAGGNDGAITVNPTGGTAPYAYSWSNGGNTASITNLSAGNYIVTVSDNNGATAELTTTLTDPPSIQVDLLEKLDVACNGKSTGRISIASSGGTGAKSIKWSNNATSYTIQNLKAGMYGFTITDANNCKLSGAYFINEPDSLSINSIITHPSCPSSKDGKISLNISGGLAPYDFTWNGVGVNPINLPMGKYNFTITDANSCVKLYSVELKSKDTISPSFNLTSMPIILDSNGIAIINPMDFITKLSDNCDTSFNIVTSRNRFDCNDLSALQKIIFEISDKSGNKKTDSINLKIEDRIAPILDCNVSYNKWNCNEKIPNPITFDNCKVSQVSILSATQKIGDPIGTYGKYSYTYIATDQSGNSKQCISNIELLPSATFNIDTIIQKKCPSDGLDVLIRVKPNLTENLLIVNHDSIFITKDTLLNYNSKSAKILISVVDSFKCLTSSQEINFPVTWDSVRLVSKQIIQPTSSTSKDGQINLVFEGGILPYSFTLINENGDIIVRNSTSSSFNGLGEGNYFCVVDDGSSCKYSHGYFELKFVTDIKPESNSSTSIIPNPFDDQIVISSNSIIQNIEIRRIDGARTSVFNNLNTTNKTIDTKMLSSGVYIALIQFDSGKTLIKRIIKN